MLPIVLSTDVCFGEISADSGINFDSFINRGFLSTTASLYIIRNATKQSEVDSIQFCVVYLNFQYTHSII